MDPATWSWLTCTWLIQTSVGGILGNRVDAKATDIWTQGRQAFTQKLRGDYPTAGNQDLEIAVYRAFLLAQRSLLCDCLAEFTGGSWTELGLTPSVLSGYDGQDVDWLKTRLKQIKADIQRLQKGDYSEVPSRALDTSVELLLVDGGLAAAGAVNMLRDELENKVLVGEPNSYRVRATAEGAGLFERVAAFFAFELKTNAKVQSLFQNQLLVQINQRLVGLSLQTVELAGIETQLKAFTQQLPDSLNNLEIAVADLGKGVDEVGWLVASRTDDLISLANSHADDLVELKRLVSDLFRQLQQQESKGIVVVQPSNSIPRTREGVNPFIYGPAVPPECFYGRKAQLVDIKQRIGGVAPQCVNIVGLRRNGKSSILRYVEERIDEFCSPAQKPLVVSIDLQERCFHQPIGIIEGLRRKIERRTGEAPWAKADNEDPFEVDDGLEALRDQGYRLIVMFDEFEAIGRRLEIFQDWGDDWRSKASCGLVTLVIASRQEVSKLYQSLELTSPFGNIFSTTILGALEAGAWQKLMTNGGLEAHEIRWVDDIAGGLPYYAQLAAAMIWQYGEFDSARQGFLEQAQPRFEELWRELSSKRRSVLSEAAVLASLLSDPGIARDLERHGLVRPDGRPFSDELANFVRQQP